MASRGAFIVFEGLDRCGKTTQSQKLLEYLQQNNVKCKPMRFPDRSLPSGQKIDKYLKREIELTDMEIHKLYSDNRWECIDKIQMELESGVTLVVDRYAFSGVAYTGAKGYDLERCKDPDRGLIAPDVVLFMDIDVDSISKRGGFGNERYERRDFQLKVWDAYQHLMDTTWKRIDARRPVEEIFSDVTRLAMETVNSEAVRQNKPLTKLWGERIVTNTSSLK